MVEPIAGVQWHGYCTYGNPLAAISSQWVGWGPHCRILFYYVFWLRKKINTTLIYFMLFFILIRTWSPRNCFICSPLASPPCRSSCPIPPPSHCVFWLIVVCSLSSGSRLMPWWILFSSFLSHTLMPQNDTKTPTPFGLPWTHLVYNTPSTSNTIFYLIVALPKAWVPTLSLFCNGFVFWCPKQPPQRKLKQIT